MGIMNPYARIESKRKRLKEIRAKMQLLKREAAELNQEIEYIEKKVAK